MNRRILTTHILLSSALYAANSFAIDEVSTLPSMTVTGDSISSIPLDLPSSAGSKLGLTSFETPASVDIITQDKMYERGYTTTQQALDSATGVQAGQCFGTTCYIMRGFSDILSLPFMYNGNRIPGLAFSPRTTFNYERIEVLKGPNSVMNGLGGITGAVNYVTKKADGKDVTDLQVGLGDSFRRTVGIGKGGSLGEDAAYRIDTEYLAANQGSFGWADETSYDYYQISGDLAFKVADKVTGGITIDTHSDDGQGYYGVPRDANNEVDERTRFNNYTVEDSNIDVDVTWVTLRFDWDPNEQTRLHNETYVDYEKRYYLDADFYTYNTTTNLVDIVEFTRILHNQRLYGNKTELTLDKPMGEMRNRFLVGLDLYHNYHQRDNNSPYLGLQSVDFLNPEPGPYSATAGLSPYSPDRRTEIDGVGIYIDDIINLTDALKVNLSFRHDNAEVDSHNLRDPSTNFTKDYSTNSWRVGVLYDIKSNLMVYGQVGKAYESPGQIVALTQAQEDFEPASAEQVEIGLKGTLLDGNADFTVAVFDILKENLLTRDANNPALTVQIGEQSSQGIELAGSFRPTDQWSIDANMALFDPQYEDFNDNVGGVAVSRKGNRPPDVPEQIGNVWTTYRPNVNWRFGLGARYVGERFTNRPNTLTMDSYTVFDANIGRKVGIGELVLNIRNLTDEFYVLRSYAGSLAVIGEPLAADLIWTARF